MAEEQQLGPLQQEWIRRLRSGEYEQGNGALNRDGRYCCLGVACSVAAEMGVVTAVRCADYGKIWYGATPEEAAGHDLFLPTAVVELFQFRDAEGQGAWGLSLAELNDNGLSFEGIASCVDASPGHYFRKPV